MASFNYAVLLIRSPISIVHRRQLRFSFTGLLLPQPSIDRFSEVLKFESFLQRLADLIVGDLWDLKRLVMVVRVTLYGSDANLFRHKKI